MMKFFFILIFLFSISVCSLYSSNNLSIYIENFTKYDELERLSSKSLIKIFSKTSIDDTKEKIKEILSKRDIKREELEVKIDISDKISLVKIFNYNTIKEIKYYPYYFTALSFDDRKIFDKNDSKYLFRVLKEAVRQRNPFVIQRVFSLDIHSVSFFNAIILINKFSLQDKIFFTSSLLEYDFNVSKKKDFKLQCLKKLYSFKNRYLQNNLIYLFFKFFNFKKDDLLKLYFKFDKEMRKVFVKAMILNNIRLPQEMIDLIDLSDDSLFSALLKYSDENNIKIKKIKKILPEKIKNKREFLLNSYPYFNEFYLKVLLKEKDLFTGFIENLINKRRKLNLINNYALENFNNFKLDLYFRIELTKYLITYNLVSNKKILKFILSLFKNKNLEYKTDEFYISVILPLLAKNYKKDDFNYYVELLKTVNLTATETTLKSIEITKDKRFIKFLKPMIKERQISYQVKKTIYYLENF